ncbi:hypothetical protein EYF80_026493 [Liparis tanakae]|uniref:Uncharacterized protein n=1 Tax=Liparis tanakae TaxID=230148 RepID=A0A4Z2HEN2_9TELE|nr:hypothetical protein EYF80_026493 [Liparis tanakae]
MTNSRHDRAAKVSIAKKPGVQQHGLGLQHRGFGSAPAGRRALVQRSSSFSRQSFQKQVVAGLGAGLRPRWSQKDLLLTRSPAHYAGLPLCTHSVLVRGQPDSSWIGAHVNMPSRCEELVCGSPRCRNNTLRLSTPPCEDENNTRQSRSPQRAELLSHSGEMHAGRNSEVWRRSCSEEGELSYTDRLPLDLVSSEKKGRLVTLWSNLPFLLGQPRRYVSKNEHYPPVLASRLWNGDRLITVYLAAPGPSSLWVPSSSEEELPSAAAQSNSTVT